MSQTNDCRFCRILDGHHTPCPVDEPFIESESYVSIASIGALIEGWSLIVPREHCLSLRNHFGREAFVSFTQAVLKRVEFEYGRAIIFEHGPNHCGSLTGCGTDHAHLHVVPAQFPLASMLEVTGISKWRRARASEISNLANDSEYLFLSETPSHVDPIGFFKLVTDPSSQFFRKAIANSIGRESVADYRQFPHLESSLRTRERLANAIRVGSPI